MSSRFRRTAWSLGLLAAGLVTACGGSDAAPEAPVAAEQSAFTLQLLHVSDADGYPFPLEADMLNLAKLETAMTPATAGGAASTSTATLGSEQDALMKYFTSQYASTPFNVADTVEASDLRIQNLARRSDTVLDAGPVALAR